MDEIFNYLANIFILNGFSLFMIGSSSRDYLLNKEISDYDFVTDATPTEIEKFLIVDSTFKKFGVVKLKYMGKHIDIATLRMENDYIDNRHPSNITFVKDIFLDYKRRDFTINCIYIDYKYNVIDPTNMGVKDLKNKILRFIKPIEISIAEDPLRILRAFRFKEQYNLTFVGNEEEILFKHKDLLNKINKQKILEERSKYKKVGGKKYDELFK